MNMQTLLAEPAAVRVEKIISARDSLTFVVVTSRRRAQRPKCRAVSGRIHSRYTRTVADLPSDDIAVRLELHTRRFSYANTKAYSVNSCLQ